MSDVITSEVHFGKVKSHHPLNVYVPPEPVRTPVRDTYERSESDIPQQMLYRAGHDGGPVSYISDSVNARMYKERLRMIQDCKDQGFTVGTMVISAEDYPIEDWTKTTLMWVDQYLLGTVDPDLGWQPLLVAYCDEKEIEYIICGPEDLVVLSTEDMAK